MGRNDKCFCGSGKKVKKCHSTVNENSKLASIYVANINFDKYVDQEKISASCPKNCSACCSDFFFVSENEFLLILDSLLRKGGIALVQKYIKKSIEYHQYLESEFPEILSNLDILMPSYNSSLSESSVFFNDNYNWDRSKKCIFLENGRCSIYTDRPHICRMYGVCATCEIVGNPNRKFSESMELAKTDIIEGDKSILKRPYPLFYYFSFFLNSDYYDLTMNKLTMIRIQDEFHYGKFTETLL